MSMKKKFFLQNMLKYKEAFLVKKSKNFFIIKKIKSFFIIKNILKK